MEHIMTLVPCFPRLADIINEARVYGFPVMMDRDHARTLIAESEGALTWCDAGETWARLVYVAPEDRTPELAAAAL